MANEAKPAPAAPEVKKEETLTPPVIDAAFVRDLMDHPEKIKALAGTPEAEEVERLIREGEISDIELAAVPTAAVEGKPPVDPVVEKPAAARRPVSSEADQRWIESQRTRVVKYKADLKAQDEILAKPAPDEDDDPEAYRAYRKEIDKAIIARQDVIAKFNIEDSENRISSRESRIAETNGRAAAMDLDSVIEKDPFFKANLNIGMSVEKAQKEIYDPWAFRLMKANGVDASKATEKDFAAAYERFQMDPEFAKNPELKTPANLEDIMVAISAKNAVATQKLSPRAALMHVIESQGKYDSWEEKAAKARDAGTQALLKEQGKRVTDVLRRRDAAPKQAPIDIGRGTVKTDGMPYDIATAKQVISQHLELKNTGKLVRLSPTDLERHGAYLATARTILEEAIAHGESIE